MASSGGGMEEMSRDELLEIIDELNKDLEERESHIQDLEKENIKLSRGRRSNRRGGDDGSDTEDVMARAAADAEMEQLRDKYDQEKIENSKLTDKINELSSFLKAVEAEKMELEADVRRLRKKADDLETAMATMQESSAQSMRRSQDITKAQKDVQKQQLQALQENEKLQQEKTELQKKLDASEERRIQIEEFIVKIADEKDTLESDKLASEAARDDMTKRVAELEALLDESEVKFQSTLTSEGQWEAQVATLRAELQAVGDRNQAEIARYKEEVADLTKQLISIRDTTSIGSKQREIDSLKEDLKNNFELLEEMHRVLEASEADKEQLAKKLVEFDNNFETKLYDKISSEREQSRVLQKRMAGLKSRLDETEARSGSYEKEIARLQREIDELNNWKVVYENGHGFQELARHQMKLKEDNRRLTLAIEELTQKVGESMDANAILYQAFEKLKAEAGFDTDFHYPDLVLKEEMQSENARLQSQVLELDEQVMVLENDCIRLRKTLKNQAGAIGEQGFKYQGMTPDMLVKVNEFAMSLRDGTLQLPMDNRSAELLQENRRLKNDMALLSAKVDKYEREILTGQVSVSRSNGPSSGPADVGLEAEMRAMRQDLQVLLSENSDLKQRQRRMQDEVLLLLSKQQQVEGSSESGKGANPVVSMVSSDISGNIENMLIASNEILMKELQELRKIASARNEDLTPRVPPSGRVPQSKQRQQGETPMLRNDVDSQSTPGTPMFSATTRFNATLGAPATPHGKQLLNKTLNNMRLPPEEWADEVRDLNAQLIECVEQLYERETELNDTKDVISNLEENLVAIKQQTTVMYFDFAEKCSQWETKEKQLIAEASSIAAERDGLKLKLRRVEETIDLMQREDPSELEAKLREYSKKIAILEVNESVLSRRYTSISEQLSEEQATKRNIQTDFAEMEGTLKRRIVQLEDYKAKAGRQLGFLQTMLDSSVPKSDYFCIQTELESLREDHLKAISRELDSRVAILKAEDDLRELASYKLKIAFLDAELKGANAGRRDLVAQLEHQKEATRRAIDGLSSPSGSANEMGLLVSEMAKFRGEASRLEVELVAANRRNELLRDQLGDANRTIDELKSASKQLSSQISHLESAEQAIRHECSALRMKFEGGLPRKEAEDLHNKLKLLTQEQDELKAEVKKQTELAEIAAQQAQSLASFRDTYLDELKELRAHCMNLESRTDDDLLIGKLQRSLISTKASYRAFAQKYQMVRSNLRQNEIALRVVETKLNEREEAVLQMHTNYRTELNALKTAIRSLWNMTDGDNSPFTEDSLKALSYVVPLPLGSNVSSKSNQFFEGFVPIGVRLHQFSDKISELASKASDYKSRAESAERTCNDREAALEDVSAERDILNRKCEDMSLVLSTSSGNETKQQQSAKAVAQRVSSLTEELKLLKLSNLQLKREVSTMKSEKKHLQTMLSNFEESVRALEKSKVTDETKQVVSDLMKQQSQGELTGEELVKKLQREIDLSKAVAPAPAMDFPGKAGERLIIDNEEYLRNLEDARNKYKDSQAELASLKSKVDAYQGRLVEAQNIIAEKDEQLNYCERVMVKEGLPSFKTGFSSAPKFDSRQSNAQKINPDQLQEAASNTIGSLKKLLSEKNETIEKYLSKIASLQEQLNDVGGGKRVSLADRRAEELLRKLQSEDERSAGAPSSRSTRDISVSDGANEKLLRQIDEAEELIKEKNRTISQLEQKLGVQENQRERAEMRCAASLQEMEAMKNDIILIAQQLQASEEKVIKLQQQNLMGHDISRQNIDVSASFTDSKAGKRPMSTADGAKINELNKALKAKDEKLKSYRTIILRLKDEFIKAEEDKAVREAGKAGDKKKGNNTSDVSMVANAAASHELEELRSQVSALRDGLKQAKEDLDQARKGREKLVKAKQTAEEEAEKFEAQIARAEAQAAAAQEALQRCRKDLEDSRRKEVRLRDKLREMLAAQHVEGEEEDGEGEEKGDDSTRRPHTAGGPSSETKSGQKIQALQREIDALRVQNEALRKQNGGADGEAIAISGAPDGLLVAAEKSTKEELRQQLHAKWESEKRLQKRLAVVEKRLQDKVQECDEIQVQLRKAKESIGTMSNSATAARERERKEREEKTRAASKAVPGGDLAQLEQANNRVFELENEVTSLRRQVEVDHPSEVNSLRFQCDNLRARVGDLESQLKLVQERRKRTGAPSLREEEEMYLREERLRDDLEALRRQKQELESLLLDKDSRIMTLTFDIDANAGELSRCRRRIRELETYCRELAAKPGAPSGVKAAWADIEGGPGANRGKREKELEGAVEAMKGVVEKLKQENDRLRRGISGAGGTDSNRAKMEADKRKIERLEEELEDLRGKATKQEDLSQKMVQKTQQIASLRKALKSKEDECTEANRRAADYEAERENLRQQLADAKANIQKLDSHVSSRITTQRDAGASVSNAASEIAEWKRKANEAAVTIEELKQKLAEARRDIASSRRGDSSSNAGLQSSAKEVEYQETIARLKSDNDRLRQELSEFDLEFFEEIENLKFAHAEAVKKLKQYELMDSRR